MAAYSFTGSASGSNANRVIMQLDCNVSGNTITAVFKTRLKDGETSSTRHNGCSYSLSIGGNTISGQFRIDYQAYGTSWQTIATHTVSGLSGTVYVSGSYENKNSSYISGGSASGNVPVTTASPPPVVTTSPPTPPTKIYLSPSPAKPGLSFTISWEGHTAGTNSTVTQYHIIWKVGSAPSASSYHGSWSPPVRLPPAFYSTSNYVPSTYGSSNTSTRGKTIYYKVKVVNNTTGGSGYSSATGSYVVNNLPGAPTVSLSATTISSTTTSVTVKSISGTKTTSNISYYQYRRKLATSSTWGNWATISTGGTLSSITGTTNFLFRAVDALGEAGNVTSITVTKNVKPVLSSSNFTISNVGTTLSADNINTSYPYITNLKTSIKHSKKGSYTWYLRVGTSSNSGSFTTKQIGTTSNVAANATAALSVDVLSILKNSFGITNLQNYRYLIGVKINDGIEDSDVIYSSTYGISYTPLTKGIFNRHNSTNIPNSPSNRFDKKLALWFSGDNNIKKIIVTAKTKTSSTTYTPTITSFAAGQKGTNGYAYITFNNLPTTTEGGVFTITVNFYRDVNSAYYMGSSTYEITRIHKPILENIFTNLSVIKPYTNHKNVNQDFYIKSNDFFPQCSDRTNASLLKSEYGIDASKDYITVDLVYGNYIFNLNLLYSNLTVMWLRRNTDDAYYLGISYDFWKNNFKKICDTLKLAGLLNATANVSFRIRITNIFDEVENTYTKEGRSSVLLLNFVEPILSVDFKVYYNSIGNLLSSSDLKKQYIYENDSLIFDITWADYNPLEKILIKIDVANMSFNKNQQTGIPLNPSEIPTENWKEFSNVTQINTGSSTSVDLKTQNTKVTYVYPEILTSYYTYYRVTVSDSYSTNTPITHYYNSYGVLVRHTAGYPVITNADYDREVDPRITTLEYYMNDYGVDTIDGLDHFDLLDSIKVDIQYTTDIKNIDNPMIFYDKDEKRFFTVDKKEFMTLREFYTKLLVLNKNENGVTTGVLSDVIDDNQRIIYVLEGYYAYLYWTKGTSTTKIENFSGEHFEEAGLLLQNIPPTTVPEWTFYYIRYKITTKIGTTRKVYYSNAFLIFNVTPTVSYRKNCLGINTYDVDLFRGVLGEATGKNDAIIVIGLATGRDVIYFNGASHEGDPFYINIDNGEIHGFIINGGTW